MKTRIIHTKIWTDSTFVDLSKNGKILFIYLISNERVGLTGAYEISNRILSFNTGLTLQEIIEAKKELDKPFVFHGEWVVIRNHNRYNNYAANKMQKKAYLREYNLVPKELQKYLMQLEAENDTSIDTSQIPLIDQSDTSIKHDRNKKQEIINHKLEIKNQNDDKAPKKTLADMKAEIGKIPASGISTQWQDEAFRHAEYLGIDLKGQEDLKGRWLRFYKNSSTNAPLRGQIQKSLSFLKDYEPFLRITTAKGRMLYFFDVVQNYDKYHSERR